MKKYIVLVLAVVLCSYTGMAQKVLMKSGKQVTIDKATTSSVGTIQLSGDLGGTAEAPTIKDNAVTTAKITDGTVTNTDLNTGVGGIYKGSGSLTSETNVTQGTNVLNFTSAATTGTSHFTVDGSTLNVDAVNNRIGIGTGNPATALEISQGTSGKSGLRFTNLNSTSSASTSSGKVLGLNSMGDVILTNVPGTQNVVSFSTATPTSSGVVFTPNTPADETVIYQSDVDNSMWTYDATTISYVTYTAPASTAWNLANTTNDAGSNKISNIWRSGNVGINTNNPSQKLDVVGNIKFSGTLMPNNSTGTTGQFLTSAGSSAAPTWTSLSTANTPNIYTQNGTVTGARTVSQGGNAIEFQTTTAHNITLTRGSSDPTTNTILSINKTLNNNPAINTALTSGGAIGGFIFRGANGSFFNESTAILSVVSENQTTTAGGGELLFYTRNNGSGNSMAEKMRINNAGNLGVGTSTPTQKLEVVGNVRFSGSLMPNNSTGTSGQVLTSQGAAAPTWTTVTTVGDIKTGIQAADHNGWVKLNGRALSTLTATQQTQAASLGLTGSLPNASNTFLVQNGTTLGSVSGSNTRTIAQNQLPNVTLTGYVSGLSTILGGGGIAGAGLGAGGGWTYVNASNIIVNSINGNVTQQNLDITPASLSVNVFIYLGL